RPTCVGSTGCSLSHRSALVFFIPDHDRRADHGYTLKKPLHLKGTGPVTRQAEACATRLCRLNRLHKTMAYPTRATCVIHFRILTDSQPFNTLEKPERRPTCVGSPRRRRVRQDC